ncbi:putative calmodulin-dependent protein kinase type 1 [Neocallimastix lanati (nom. inval.)]|jgi:serine/threonine protein kinase|uniref:Putative calmodulin-dependent protein kinase type 1 n=1 Tax=Neocallimastix californiae TaxID=1754190 RepID=A0A1Y2DRW7_9FUNG|nr:putative calmodulin-dependent protein kinase type 1 [Neocallimastix sp. JGI-2020a]ORY61884.1 putative calmodulin-dependent protein kinase type 1 [Neocallimastix californiae]|eukprot:ORY61884.1 putative calmodulin-dependent protein kinase type 1 [Neocallimastix californiae]
MAPNPPSVVISKSADNQPPLLPCPYRTGKFLGQGSYAKVKEAIEIETGKKFAAKVINKEFMAGKEMLFINELNILKKVSKAHPNLVTLHSYFETPLNWYLIMDLCEGGELFDRLYQKGTFYEKDAINVIKQVIEGIAYLHDNNIVHRDIKAENIMFRTKDEDSEIVIADFGLSRFINNDSDRMLQTVCGTQGYMAPEIILHKGHGKPVDMWAIGVLTFIILSGYCPFSGETVAEENNNIVHCNYEFEPAEFWAGISENAKDFIRKLLVLDPEKRMTAHEALQHEWIISKPAEAVDLLPTVRDNLKKKFRKAVIAINVVNRLRTPQNVGRPITRSPSPSPFINKEKLNVKEE